MFKRIVFDIETNNLLGYVTKIHCISLYCLDTKKVALFVSAEEQEEALKVMSGASLLVGHNICQYDLPVLKMMTRWEPDVDTEIYDTLVASFILWPEEFRSLEVWAKILRLSQEKIQNEDWSVYTELMGKRCLADTVINAEVYEYIRKQRHENLIEPARLLEQHVARIHAAQVVHGVGFDIIRGQQYHEDLDKRVEDLRKEIIAESPTKCLILGTALKNQVGTKKQRVRDLEDGIIPPCTACKTKAGVYTAVTKKYFPDIEDLCTVKGPYTKVEFRNVNPDSPQEMKDLLLDLGWKPTEYNVVKDADGTWRATSPKLTEDSYSSLPAGLGQNIAQYNTLKHRRNFLQNLKDPEKGALPEARRGNGRVQAHAFTCGTPTARYRHNGVVCNIPRVSSIYGKELRSLFCVSRDNLQVGVDLSGIEARMLAHYLLLGNYRNARETADLILSPDKLNDFHSFNAKVWGVDRDTAKTCLYALMYGAGAKKLAGILGRSENHGAAIKKEFYKAHPAIKELIDDLTRTYRTRGHLIAIDGRPLYCRGENKLLNQLLQNAAAVVFKRWMLRCDEYARTFEIKFKVSLNQMIAYHDETQWEIGTKDQEVAKRWGYAVLGAALEVGEEMDILVPIEAEFKVGLNWADCH